MAAKSKSMFRVLFLQVFAGIVASSTQNDAFYEELFIKPFRSGHVMFNFQFTTVWNVSIADPALFPKSLGDVLMTYRVQELHLTQTKGLWRYEKWGYPPNDASPGAELWVWFLPNTEKIDRVWADLVNALSGLFCSSLNFMDSKSTIRPRWTFRPQGLASEGYSLFSGLLRYSALPNEVVCTENLTPWKKLLPCDSKIGLSTLFNASVDFGFSLNPPPDRVEEFTRGHERRVYAVYNLGEQLDAIRIFNLEANYNTKPAYGRSEPPPVYARRYITGYGLEKGGITCHIYNDLDENLTLIYMDTIPWFLRVYFNTLKIENGDKMHYIPGKDRTRPYQIEIVFRLRAKSVTKLSLSFDRAFLKWTEYPPDANHGFYVNSAVLSTVLPVAFHYTAIPQNVSTIEESLNDTSTDFFLRLHTDTLLVSLPTPDFSMPYNVICLACTVVAIAFGSLHNLTTRRFIIMDPSQKKGGPLQKIKKFFKRDKKSEIDNKPNKDNKIAHKTDSDKDKRDDSCIILVVGKNNKIFAIFIISLTDSDMFVFKLLLRNLKTILTFKRKNVEIIIEKKKN
ncbi:hypothetical protein KUTeg_019816 [Tegillarca granosa]|uniref:GPI transamidase component PIG-T n=1 Tax=Tegillarca granosa TaxID=220873 RepID=A0ABQ9EJ45_TEGGR|nr:hypothetical protein KUTeg_019816 [Tegillarca granosa]